MVFFHIIFDFSYLRFDKFLKLLDLSLARYVTQVGLVIQDALALATNWLLTPAVDAVLNIDINFISNRHCPVTENVIKINIKYNHGIE